MKGLTENVSFAIVDFLVCKRGRAQLNREKDLYKNSLVFVSVIWKGGGGGEKIKVFVMNMNRNTIQENTRENEWAKSKGGQRKR